MFYKQCRPIIGFVVGFALLAACTEKPIVSSKDIPPGKALIIGKAYSETLLTDLLFKKDQKVTGEVAIRLVRFDPPDLPDKKDRFSREVFFWGDIKKISVDDGFPGEYHFSSFKYGGVIYRFEPTDPRYDVSVKPGEAVYIGDVVIRGTHSLWSGSKGFRLSIEDESEKARAFFEEKFGDSGLKFTKRLLKRMPLNPVLPK